MNAVALPERLRALFASELANQCTILEEVGLGLLSTDPSIEPQDALRALHTLKGNSSMMGFRELAAYIHLVEDAIRRARQAGTAYLGKLLVAVADQLRGSSDGAAPNPPTVPDVLATAPVLISARTRTAREHHRVSVDADVLHRTFAESEGLRARFFDGHRRIEAQLQAQLSRSLLGMCQTPVRPLTTKLRRVVLDVMGQLDRRVELVVHGEERQTDAGIVEVLSEALPHLLRNAIDHGLEPPAQRVAGGKPALGVVRVRFTDERGRFLVTLEDDGRGIDVAEVGRRARAAGLVDDDELASMTTYERLLLIFHPGLSTRDVATQISGRGVGLSAVRDAVVRIGGDVQVDSLAGLGTRFTLSFPSGLEWSEHLIVELGGHLLGVPVQCVRRLWDHDDPPLTSEGCIHIDGRPIPIIGFAAMDPRFGDEQARPTALLELDGAEVALGVDRLVGFGGAVVQPVDTVVAGTFIAGLARDPDGRSVWLIDTAELTRNWNAYVIPEDPLR
ncbi:MAG: ATP-binding protein [Kofleriaceae bacterium]|nr:ATP-binding protein [Kofleriaceae bacterium]